MAEHHAVGQFNKTRHHALEDGNPRVLEALLAQGFDPSLRFSSPKVLTLEERLGDLKESFHVDRNRALIGAKTWIPTSQGFFGKELLQPDSASRF